MIPQGSPGRLPLALQTEVLRALSQFDDACSAVNVTSPRERAELTRLFAASPFMATYAAREPARFVALVGEGAPLEAAREPQWHRARIAAALAPASTDDEVRRALRQHRNAELVRIAWRDLAGVATLEAVLQELSALADALVAETARWVANQLESRFGIPCDEKGERVALLVLAMGKLGGHELNFSSDIDLIFLYRAAGESLGGARSLANQEFFDRLGRRLIALLNDTTSDGFVYRVDMRLRPFGESGALTTSFSSLEHYYEMHGRDWERYALIKGRVIEGPASDVQLLESITRPFVFRRYLDFGALEAVRAMKALITAEVERYGLEHDVKRGAGGIREVEFIGQMFQLIRGGREPRLRARGIVDVLMTCADLGLMPQAEVEGLVEAYRFLRVTEHRLQQVRDEQTQALPLSPDERARLAFGLGFTDWTVFLAALEHHRAHVRHSFAELLAPSSPALPTAPALDVLWRDALDAERSQALLATAGFDDLPAAEAVIADLKDARFLGRLSGEARARLDRLMPALVAACAGKPSSAETLRRVAGLVHAVARRSVYLALLADNPDALRRLVDLCSASRWVSRELIASPILLDELLDRRALLSPPARRSLERQLDDLLMAADEDGLERVMEVLRLFQHQQMLRVAASDLMAGFPVAAVSNHLTMIAETLVDRARALAWRGLGARHGIPAGEATPEAGFAIIAYGKLGGLELGYGSDLDLVFVHERVAGQTPGEKAIAGEVFFTRLAQRIIHLLATRTPAGVTYELDVRLRPSGAAGLLVSSIDAFADYQSREAWTWEHQALVRARAVAGDPVTKARFEAVRRTVLTQPRDPLRLGQEIVEMRHRMRAERDRSDADTFDLKHGLGGITDIEFVVQYAVLRWAAEFPALCTCTDNLRLLDLIADLGLLPRADCDALRAAYFAYRAEGHRCALQEIDGLVETTRFREERQAVNTAWSHAMQP